MKRILENPNIYNFYQYIVGNKRYLAYLSDKIILTSKPKSFLDLGCGTANILAFLGNEIKYTGIEISQKYIDYAKRKYPNHKFFCSDICQKQNISEPFDVILSEGVMAALDDENLRKKFQTICSIANKETRIILSDMNYKDDACWFQKFMQSNERNANLRGKSEYLKILNEYFEVKEIWELQGLFYFPYEKVVFECRIKN